MHLEIMEWKHKTVVIHKPVCNLVIMLNGRIPFGIGLSWAAVTSVRVRGRQGFRARVSVRLPFSLSFSSSFFVIEVLVFIMPFSMT